MDDSNLESGRVTPDLVLPGDDNDYDEAGNLLFGNNEADTGSTQGVPGTKKRKRKQKKTKDGKTKKKKKEKIKKDANHRKNIRCVICNLLSHFTL